MHSVVIINWEDREFMDRIAYALGKSGYVRSEDYEALGVRTMVWTKDPKLNLSGRVINPTSDSLLPIQSLPVDQMVQRILPRLKDAIDHLPGQTPLWTEHLATNLIFDLMGKPG